MFEQIKKLFAVANTYKSMASPAEVASIIPSDTVYVTLADVLVQDGPVEISGMQYENGMMKRSVVGAENGEMTSVYMLHDGRQLVFMNREQTLLSTPLENIAALQSLQGLTPYKRSIRGGFVCNLKDGRSILVSSPMRVSTDQTTHYRTIAGIANDITGGWGKELAPYGIETIY